MSPNINTNLSSQCVPSASPTGAQDRRVVDMDGVFKDCAPIESFNSMEVPAMDLLAILAEMPEACTGADIKLLAEDFYAKVVDAIKDAGHAGKYEVIIGSSEPSGGTWVEVPTRFYAHLVRVVAIDGAKVPFYAGASNGLRAKCTPTDPFVWIEPAIWIEHGFEYCAGTITFN